MVEMGFKAREGDLIETRSNAFFDVKGLVHPPRKVVAFIRFFPNPKGDNDTNCFENDFLNFSYSTQYLMSSFVKFH
jgi:predicted nucleotidyltransferase